MTRRRRPCPPRSKTEAAPPRTACLSPSRRRREQAARAAHAVGARRPHGRRAAERRAAPARAEGACREPALHPRTPRAYAAAISAGGRPEQHERAAARLRAARGPILPEALREEIVRETLAIVRRCPLRPALRAGQPRRGSHRGAISAGDDALDLSGQIDRLSSILDDACWFSTTRRIGRRRDARGGRAGLFAQLAAYRAALRAHVSQAASAGRASSGPTAPSSWKSHQLCLMRRNAATWRRGRRALTLRRAHT